MKTVYCSFIRVKETSIKRNPYFSVKINEIPRFARNDKFFPLISGTNGSSRIVTTFPDRQRRAMQATGRNDRGHT